MKGPNKFSSYDTEDILLVIILLISVILGIAIIVYAVVNRENSKKDVPLHTSRSVEEVLDSLARSQAKDKSKELTYRQRVTNSPKTDKKKETILDNAQKEKIIDVEEKSTHVEKLIIDSTEQTVSKEVKIDRSTNNTSNQLEDTKKTQFPVFVDLGLSVKWATSNIGAESSYDLGDYYAWGEISTKSSYNLSSCKTYLKKIKDFSGNAVYDVATSKLGMKYRVPTKMEFEELKNKCEWQWIQLGRNQYGYRVTGPNGRSIILPAAGFFDGSSKTYVGSIGEYWTSTPSGNQGAEFFSLSKNDKGIRYDHRYKGKSIRAVTK